VVRSTVVDDGVTGEETVVLVVVADVGSTSRLTLIQPLVRATAVKAEAKVMLRRKLIDFICNVFTRISQAL
jgi:hypothetical protein